MVQVHIFDKASCCFDGIDPPCEGNCLSTKFDDDSKVASDICINDGKQYWKITSSGETYKLIHSSGKCLSGTDLRTCDPLDPKQSLSKLTGDKGFLLSNDGGDTCYSSTSNKYLPCDERDNSQVFRERDRGDGFSFIQNVEGVCVPCSYIKGDCNSFKEDYCINNVADHRCKDWFNSLTDEKKSEVCKKNKDYSMCKAMTLNTIIAVAGILFLLVLAFIFYKTMIK